VLRLFVEFVQFKLRVICPKCAWTYQVNIMNQHW